MKKLINLSLVIIGLTTTAFLGGRYIEQAQGTSGADVFHLYNWGDYIDSDLIEQFEEETGYRVVYETFDSNEAMYTKVQQGGTGYDLAIPSEYMIERMIEEDLVVELEHSRIEGLEHIDPDFLDLNFDPGNRYSIPYFWGTLGIAYNEDLLEGFEPESWEDLYRPELADSILMIDGAREVIGIGLQTLGYSLNSRDSSELQQAADQLTELSPNIKALVADEIKMYMIQEEAAIAVTYSGEAADMMWENESIVYILPEEGSNLWFDNMVIPHTVQNEEAAYAFINFMLDPEIAAQNADYIGYSTPNQTAMDYLPEETVEDEQFYPSQDMMDNLEVYEDLGLEYTGIYNDLFLEFKMIK
ncbi:ABC transporter substrate-binding protein [Alkalibacterium pelagium]|uniref:Spermidine/putrescine transport system substrate-binding protein n=1 Tax=Alkalibacterium pelagium TaxID=426702 RepID=A0A1H7F4L3_9LACT|nr:ABC transporter substrate-binding protein [Alkalibacterium pelagium]GEN49598.1 spermidine/putrescine ABC transporter substrate-binding protein [Alkalibacterium pelagium]SEK18085.1 spermidine/putrescine transport system substrate-binding protein [Alkalibacterium pelagium]